MAVGQRVLGGNLRDHAIGREDVHNVEPFEHRSRKRDPSRVVVAVDVGLCVEATAEDARVATFEGDQAFKTSCADLSCREAFPTRFIQDDVAVLFDGLLDGMLDVAAKQMSFRVIDVIALQDRAWSCK